mmetsp:Transcript_41129/g.162459  ORF Transcript_41129/g.162459 Transcript_41129/m.162459 type:complete len:83 (-) Transcript_41129:21-269(-)
MRPQQRKGSIAASFEPIRIMIFLVSQVASFRGSFSPLWRQGPVLNLAVIHENDLKFKNIKYSRKRGNRETFKSGRDLTGAEL